MKKSNLFLALFLLLLPFAASSQLILPGSGTNTITFPPASTNYCFIPDGDSQIFTTTWLDASNNPVCDWQGYTWIGGWYEVVSNLTFLAGPVQNMGNAATYSSWAIQSVSSTNLNQCLRSWENAAFETLYVTGYLSGFYDGSGNLHFQNYARITFDAGGFPISTNFGAYTNLPCDSAGNVRFAGYVDCTFGPFFSPDRSVASKFYRMVQTWAATTNDSANGASTNDLSGLTNSVGGTADSDVPNLPSCLWEIIVVLMLLVGVFYVVLKILETICRIFHNTPADPDPDPPKNDPPKK